MQNLIDFAFSHFLKIENLDFKVYNFDFQPIQYLDNNIFKNISKYDFLEVLENLHINFLNSEFIYQNQKLKRCSSKINLKESGSVYTQKEIAQKITLQTIEYSASQNKTIENLKILDFGCGTGRIYFSIVKILNEKFNIPLIKIIKNLYAIDNNEIALVILKLKILFEIGLEYLEIINQNIIQRNMLIVKHGLHEQKSNYLDLKSDFSFVLQKGGFDCVIANPPYFLLKINQNNTKDIIFKKYYELLAERINFELQYFRNSGFYHYSIEGMLNYYKLSIEMILKLTKSNGEIGIICPSTLFGDASSTKLRKYILEKNQLHKIEFFEEKAKLFDNVSQATAIFYLSKENKTQEFEVKITDKNFQISYNLIKNTFSENLEIPQMEEMGWNILKKLSQFKKLKEFKNLRNRRGEFDLLQYKNLITVQDTGFRLIRGNMINCNTIDYTKQSEFVKIEEFKKAKSDEFLRYDFQKIRLVCQQVSNIDISKRLKFLSCAENDILANSCNYITMKDLSQIKNLQVLLNSYLLNWRFKVTSTNNHINNYELDELPLIDFTKFSNSMNGNELKNNVEIAKEYGLNNTEILYILQNFFPKNDIEYYL
jgi:Alw26I/Eco31I/Esp3I family type II restriction m6 adenine DNA methyltransferase